QRAAVLGIEFDRSNSRIDQAGSRRIDGPRKRLAGLAVPSCIGFASGPSDHFIEANPGLLQLAYAWLLIRERRECDVALDTAFQPVERRIQLRSNRRSGPLQVQVLRQRQLDLQS